MKPFLITYLALAGCAAIPPVSAGPTAGLGETANVGGVQVRPLRVVEDSRCPANAVCVWEGRLRVEAAVDARGGSETHRIVLTLRQPATLGDATLTMVEAQPVKLDSPVDPRSYRFTFRFEPRP